MANPRYSLDLNTGIRTDLSSGQTYDTRNQQAISSDTLQSNPSPLKLPEETPDTSTTKINSLTNSYASNTDQEFDNELNTLKSKYGDTNAVTNLMKQISDTESGQNIIADDLGATDNLKKYKKYTKDIQLEDETLRQAEERILRENPTGALRGGQADLLTNLRRESANRKAVMTIEKSAALGDYETAVNTAKAKVEMELAPMKAELDRLKYIQENNKEFKTAEINSLIKRKENEYTEQKENKDKANEMIINALSLSAPTSAINNAKDILAKGGTATEVAMALGKYSGDYYKVELLKQQIETEKAQRANIYANIDKTKAESGAGKPATQAQYTASGFASRVVQAKDIIDSNSANLSGLSTVEYLGQRNLPNALQSPLIQQQLQAERNFVNAVLRRESGAAISPEEFKSAEKQYFPMPGDSAEVLAQKKANRDLTSANLINESGTAYSVPPPVNKFSLSLGKTGQTIPGSSIVQSVAPTGSINFIIPNSPKK